MLQSSHGVQDKNDKYVACWFAPLRWPAPVTKRSLAVSILASSQEKGHGSRSSALMASPNLKKPPFPPGFHVSPRKLVGIRQIQHPIGGISERHFVIYVGPGRPG